MTSGTLRTILIVGAAVAAVSVAACKQNAPNTADNSAAAAASDANAAMASANAASNSSPWPPTPPPTTPRRLPPMQRGVEQPVSPLRSACFRRAAPRGGPFRLAPISTRCLTAPTIRPWSSTPTARRARAATATSTSRAQAAWPSPGRCSWPAAACPSAGRGAPPSRSPSSGFGTGLNIAGPARAVARRASAGRAPLDLLGRGRAAQARRRGAARSPPCPSWRTPPRCSPAAGPAGPAASTASTCRSSARRSTWR